MEERALGATGLRVSVVTYGAMGLGPASEADDSRRASVIQAAIEAGVTSIDTAPLYGFGRSERVIGRALAGLDPRPAVLTKVGLRWDDTHGEPLFRARADDGEEVVVRRDSRPESVMLEIERSLERMRIDRLDLVQVHQRDRLVPIGETMSALRDAVRAGAVRAVGVSNFTAQEIEEARRALGDVPLASVQSELSLLARDVLRDGLRATRKHGTGFLAYSPLAQGLLTGGYGPERELHRDDWRRSQPRFSKASRKRIARAIREVAWPIARAHGATPSQVALAWVLARTGVSAVIAGASSEAQARENVGAAALRLEGPELTRLEEAFAPVGPLRRLVARVLGR